MKPWIVALAMMSLVTSTRASQMGQASPPSPAQSEQIAKGQTHVGTIGKARLVKGHGFSHIHLLIEVSADNGKIDQFYLREATIAVDANGAYVEWGQIPNLKGKKVEIKYAPITETTGGLEKVEIGKNGVLWIRFLDWSAKAK